MSVEPLLPRVAEGASPEEVLAALLVMFVPQVWFYGLAVVCAGVLQAHGRFLAAAAGPLVSSLVVIGGYGLFARLAVPGPGPDHRPRHLHGRPLPVLL